ncbi:AbrB/MazE/SpoVT family DNA-binding domain-containing protein [Candidatus Woesearchaeota archaeon]|nr:AbrB/MazE/SpoVT family DNA-binding domain-containing protein [Candidatus Woesearchaeota archaeon]
MFKATIEKWGNSFRVLFPKEVIESQRLQEGDTVSVQVINLNDENADYSSSKS